MTGPGPGKLEVNATVEYCDSRGCRVLAARVYVHLRGWSRARVTHIDIEAPGLERIVGGPGQGIYVKVYGGNTGLTIIPANEPSWKLVVKTSDPLLHPLRPGESCIGYLGGKKGGVYLGLSSPYHRVLEELAYMHRGVRPRSRGKRD